MKNVLILLLLCIFMGACQKDEEISPLRDEASSYVNNEAIVDAITLDPSIMQPKISSSSILNATSMTNIPKQMFAVSSIYKPAYYHNKQPNGTSCSWTSYVNCINCIVTANNNYCYPTSISTVRNRCTNNYPAVNTNGASHILALEWHVNTYDNGYVAYDRQSPTNRWTATKKMLAHINTHHSPFLVRSSIGGIGHYRVVFSIDWQQSEAASTVYYTDCLYPDNGSFSANIRSMSLNNFLTYMTVGASCHNMLFMWPN